MNLPENLDWDLLRVFLAIMRSSSLRQAAERLGVSHPTARRHLEQLEATLNLHLFDRRSDGLHATPAAAALLDAAEDVESSIHALRRQAKGADPELSGLVRVTVPNAVATHVLMSEFAAFNQRHPKIELDVHVSYELADLGAREADVAIRAVPVGQRPSERLTGRKAVTAYNAVYGSPHQWVGYWGESRDREWIRKTAFPELPTAGRFPDPLLQIEAAKQGMGLVLSPCFLGDGVLERRTKPQPYMDVWVLVHPDLRRSPRLRIFRDEMVAALKRMRPWLQGKRAHMVPVG